MLNEDCYPNVHILIFMSLYQPGTLLIYTTYSECVTYLYFMWRKVCPNEELVNCNTNNNNDFCCIVSNTPSIIPIIIQT